MLDPHDDTDVLSGSTDGAQMESTSSPVPREQVPPFLEIEGDRPGLYTRILRETAWFLGEVHHLRWIEPRERRQ